MTVNQRLMESAVGITTTSGESSRKGSGLSILCVQTVNIINAANLQPRFITSFLLNKHLLVGSIRITSLHSALHVTRQDIED